MVNSSLTRHDSKPVSLWTNPAATVMQGLIPRANERPADVLARDSDTCAKTSYTSVTEDAAPRDVVLTSRTEATTLRPSHAMIEGEATLLRPASCRRPLQTARVHMLRQRLGTQRGCGRTRATPSALMLNALSDLLRKLSSCNARLVKGIAPMLLTTGARGECSDKEVVRLGLPVPRGWRCAVVSSLRKASTRGRATGWWQTTCEL
jgi:hypothetical protein